MLTIYNQVTLIPVSIALKSRVPTGQKLMLVGIFSLSLIITIFSIVRFALNSPSRGKTSPSWLESWSTIEQSVSVVVACLASLRMLVISNNRQAEKAASRRPAGGIQISGDSSSRPRTGKSSFPYLRSHRSSSMDIELLEPDTSKASCSQTTGAKAEDLSRNSGTSGPPLESGTV